MDKRKDSNKHLDPPAVFQITRPTGFTELIPPSHFQSQSAPPPIVSPTGLLGAAAYPNWEEIAELRRENLHLKDELQRWNTKVDTTEDPKDKTRSLDRLAEPSNVTLAMSQQAEIIAHQLHEIQRLESEISALRVSSAQQEATIAARESTLSNLQGELTFLKSQNLTEVALLKTQLEEVRKNSQQEKEALRNELEELRKQNQLKTDFLREELESTKERSIHEITLAQGELQQMREEREVERRRQEAMVQECRQSVLKEYQTKLDKLSEVYEAEVTSLKHQICAFKQDLEAQRKEASQLREKKDMLQNQLSVTEAELASQNALVLQFKTYVGEQKSNKPGFEQEQLINRIQQLEDEKGALKMTAELLEVRVASLGDILTLQETELGKKVHLQDPLRSESSQKLQGLLTRWREKVFSLLVQLKSQELSHREDTKRLEKKVKEMEEDVASREQKAVLLLHSLEDKTAEADMERVRNKTLQAEMLRSNEQMHGFQQRAEADEKALQELADFVSRLKQQLMGQEERWKAALLRLLGLGNRVSFATKRVDIIQGLVCRKIALAKLQREEKHIAGRDQEIQPSYEDLQAELHMLHDERDRLSAELKHGAQLIEKKVAEARERVETDLSKMRGTLQHLQETLEAKTMVEQELRQQLEATEKQLETTNSELQRTAGAADSLRQEVGQLRGEYERALQEKVSEVETQLRKDLSEMEKALNTARREHAKAVVALRQAERQAGRDKARSEELAKIQESATQQEMARLEGRLKELERDKNVLMATLRQEGLLAQYRQNRLSAVPAKSIGKTGTGPPSKESLFAVLDDLQTLGAAILEEEERDKNTNIIMDI
ncbi:coiled-coil alpha-helical rod protein 1 isoform X1 [Pseudonaja textilis]|uniref:coiled-coil alpha-helical rod protein 1 isoform X1 n=1 Tax=Pseudonaja textilis TaxID=8673 RepID=UPI000EA94064|nr:coiled-coil alpha-helical rod protein 1 isoform X1 [Pseudonaja textilis]XP_026576205.1 coiled-coil alpha-helical rod protein 1 isoform X1 [Pseudonaja textilis]